jgi:hypothetical protein
VRLLRLRPTETESEQRIDVGGPMGFLLLKNPKRRTNVNFIYIAHDGIVTSLDDLFFPASAGGQKELTHEGALFEVEPGEYRVCTTQALTTACPAAVVIAGARADIELAGE